MTIINKREDTGSICHAHDRFELASPRGTLCMYSVYVKDKQYILSVLIE